MYLLLGNPQDLCCTRVRNVLLARKCPTQVIANPLVSPARLTWRLNSEESASRLTWDGHAPLQDDQIAGVLVRGVGWIDPAGWQPQDLAYMQAETQAALLAWLWSLACPVVNRYSAAIWYQPRAPLLSWRRLLRQAGLATAQTLVTNVEHEARAFGQQLARKGVAGVVYGPLTSDVRYLISGDPEWQGLAEMQLKAPVCLIYPHDAAQFVCVVGEQVVWEGEPPPGARRLDQRLRRFAAAAGLSFVELALASTIDGTCVIAVEPHPHLERFSDVAQEQIAQGIVDILTVAAGGIRSVTPQVLQRSLL